jgi:RES domain-containing protein
MTAVAASDNASDAVFTSSTAKLAVWNSNTALSAYQANPTQVQRQITERGVTSTTTSSNFTFVALNTKVILLRAWVGAANEQMPLAWRNTSTTVTPTINSTDGVLLPNGDSLGTNIFPPNGRTTTYANSGTGALLNNDNSNVVSAANGLQQISHRAGASKNVIYITV